MTLGLAFWILMLLWLVWTGWSAWPNWQPALAGNLIVFLLLLLLGWAEFGPPIRG